VRRLRDVLVVVPFRATGKTRLPLELRAELAEAMLRDVVEAALGVGGVLVVTDDPGAVPDGAARLPDPGGGQGAAVAAGLALAHGPALVVNADVPCATEVALRRLTETGAALVAAADGTTNALSLPDPGRFRDLYGPGSASRFAALGLERVAIPELEHDVDTLADLAALDPGSLGRRTALVVDRHKRVTARAR
jgi:2-phospho-L-lactate guanylyltransferase (CobY/MobA/RfbA family)